MPSWTRYPFPLVVIACALTLVRCAAFGQDPATAAKAAHDTSLAACLGCRDPRLPAEAKAACERLEPVCAALAGLCAASPEARQDALGAGGEAALVAPPPGYGRRAL